MSRRETKDYRAVFRALQLLVPGLAVVEAVCDFEKATWSALKEVFLHISIRGCWFHWEQAVFKKVSESKSIPNIERANVFPYFQIMKQELKSAYQKQPRVRSFLKLLMALPHLPQEHIPQAFENIRQSPLLTDARINKVVGYIEKNWIASRIHPPSSWSVYKRHIRTNNGRLN